MENLRKDQGISNHQVGHWRSSSHNEKPPLGKVSFCFPFLSFGFVLSFDSFYFFWFTDNRHMNMHSNVMNWVDYAVKEAFDDAKFRIWAENNGFPCNMYIDDADWDNDKEVMEPSYVAEGWRSSNHGNNETNSPEKNDSQRWIPKEYYGGDLHDMYQAGNGENRNLGTWEGNNRSTENSMSWSKNDAYQHDNNECKMNPERRGRGRGRGRREGGRRGRRGNYTPSLW